MSAWTDEKKATTEVHEVAEKVKSEVQEHIHHTVPMYVTETYREQDQPIMLGKLQLIKVNTGDTSNFLHVEVFIPRSQPPSEAILLAVQENFSSSAPLKPLV